MSLSAAEALEMIAHYGRALTKRQRQILRIMAAAEARHDYDGAEFVCEGRECYVGLERTSRRTFYALLRACAINGSPVNDGGFEVYYINERGRELARLDD